MLLDSGSELNIITQELQEGLGLPMDPSGANWTLRGVSGHPHSMEITIYQPRILVEYCDLMTSISTVSQGFLFCCIFKISQPVS